MIVSYKQLKQFVDLDGLSVEEVTKKLTFAGIEVEEIKHFASGTNLVIGQILECENHPSSDHLHVLKVDLGSKFGIKQIVCGAPNARKGLKVIVARVGANLIGGKISLSTIRGVESEGMCCSLLELGVDSKYLSEYQTKGIEELDENAPVGEEDVLGYLGLDDISLDLNILANRSDLLSIKNIAREVGAIFKRKLKEEKKEPIVNFTTTFEIGSKTDRCTQFSGKEIKNIKIGKSPIWLVRALNAMGVRSINNIVDIGNYVMLVTGQPLHMYDTDKLPSKSLYARDDITSTFTALDEKTYQLQKGDICICSLDEVMCLGGVMGSLKCAVDENTKNIFIESASFDGPSVRHTSTRLGLSSESSMRFVKGTNHFQAEEVLNLTASLIKKLCGGDEFSNIITYQKEKYEEVVIHSSIKKINDRLGTNFSPSLIKDTLSRLYFKVDMNDDGTFKAVVPPFRLDVKEAADLSEEVIRLLGYDNIVSSLPTFNSTVGKMSEISEKLSIIENALLNKGFDQCLTYSLINKKEVDKFSSFFKDETYRLLNPLTDDHEVLRTNIVHSLLEVASYNLARQNKNLAFFESGLISTKKEQSHHLGIVMAGDKLEQLELKTRPYDFYDGKGVIEMIMEMLGVESSRYKLEKNNVVKELHPGKSALIYVQNKSIGFVGELHPLTKQEYDLNKVNVVVIELVLDDLLTLKTKDVKATSFSRFPSVKRDLALLVKNEIQVGDLLKLIKSTGKGLVVAVNVFDVYQGENIAKGFKSVAINITFSSLDHTLLEKEVNLVEEEIKFELNKRFGAILRS